MVLIAGLLAYGVLPQLAFFGHGWRALGASDWRLAIVSLAVLAIIYLAASLAYLLLTPRRLSLGATYLVQLAGAFAGRVLPAGLGGLGVNYIYVRRRGCAPAVAGTVVAANNTLGFVGHMLLLSVCLLLLPAARAQIHWPVGRPYGWWWLVIAVAAATLALAGWLLRSRIGKALVAVRRQLTRYRKQPSRVLLALACTMVVTAGNAAILWLACRAVGAPVTAVAALIALTTGVAAQTATPTPGGVGGVEAGLVLGLTLAGMPVDSALIAAILFRLATFWLPLLVGAGAFLMAMRLRYL